MGLNKCRQREVATNRTTRHNAPAATTNREPITGTTRVSPPRQNRARAYCSLAFSSTASSSHMRGPSCLSLSLLSQPSLPSEVISSERHSLPHRPREIEAFSSMPFLVSWPPHTISPSRHMPGLRLHISISLSSAFRHNRLEATPRRPVFSHSCHFRHAPDVFSKAALESSLLRTGFSSSPEQPSSLRIAADRASRPRPECLIPSTISCTDIDIS